MPSTLNITELVTAAATAQASAKTTLAAAQKALKAASFAVEKRVKLSMPVDTGRARTSWGHWTPADVRGGTRVSKAHTSGGLKRAAAKGMPNASDPVWEEADNGLTITQGSNVPYIEYLNNGHSRQAPAGFLDKAQQVGQLELEKSLGLIDPTDPNLQWLQFA